MIAFSVPDWLAGVGVLAGAIAALIAAAGVIAKSRLGKGFVWVYRRLFGEPLTDKFTAVVTRVVTPQLTRLEDKNDRQHAENKTAIQRLTETVIEHRLETRDHLFELRQQARANHEILQAHFGEAAKRDERIAALELRNVDVRITASPTSGEVPVTPPAEEEP